MPLSLEIKHVHLSSPFWRNYQTLVRDVVLPYQWEVLNDRIEGAEPSHAIANFKIAAGRESGEFHGMVFQDSDVYKWLEAAAYLIHQYHDQTLESRADEVIELLHAAQQEDGYLNTYYILKAPQARWSNLAECHELYCAGHLFEAGVAYFHATGKRRLLEVCCRFADHIAAMFGPGPEQQQGYPGHPEIELALLRLYETTGQSRYLALARYFIDQRGTQPHWYDLEFTRRGGVSFWENHGPHWMVRDKAYSQAHLPLREQPTATGHAVRFTYLLTAAAHLARLDDDLGLRQTCLRLWEDMAGRQMYVTGSIGAQGWGESLTSAYDLPSDTAYAESCASVGIMMFARRMLELEGDARFADVMERALFNTVLAGMALDGKAFFYVNPLESVPSVMPHHHIYDHVKPVRQCWFACACCPPNIARTLAWLGQYVYTRRHDALYINLYAGGEADFMCDGTPFKLRQSTHYPWDGRVKIEILAQASFFATLALRIPDWCEGPWLWIDDVPVAIQTDKGYVHLAREWQPGTRLCLDIPMPVRRVRAHPDVRQAAGQVAVQRGPLVYCLEQADNGSGLHHLALPLDARFKIVPGDGMLQGMSVIETNGLRREPGTNNALYRYDAAPAAWRAQRLRLIPYFAWANRGEGEMRVWIDEP